ncbi:MAG: DUF1622 domain-containing protein [Xenococcaceae cyanobacterium MO_188.B29]|nr:DUF1622 domain-containing protein [Xenococcaceae cyanobacterium MO_188.B29]
MGFNYLAIALASRENVPLEDNLDLNHVAEAFLIQTAFFLKIAIECFALLILTIGIIRAIIKLLAVRKRIDRPKVLYSVRLDLGLSLVLSLEFLLAADIAATAISPSWDAIGKLAAVSGIRTFLNYFLQKEVQELENHK